MPNLLERFQRHIADTKLLDPNHSLLVGVSGGADSVCLLRLLQESGLTVTALHCNFHLRGEESDRDQQFVERLCHDLGISLFVKDFCTTEHASQTKSSIEMAARELRYKWFDEMIAQHDVQGIAIAHHREDQAETLLLNLIRGTGIRGLAAMPPKNGNVIRPLLPFSRQEILDYLAEIKQDYVTDSTNLEREAQRNILRLDVIPLLQSINPQAVSNIASAAEHVQEILPYTQQAMVQAIESCKTDENAVDIHLLLQKESPASLLHEWLHPAGFNSQQVMQILANIQGESGARYESKSHVLLRDRGLLILRNLEASNIPEIKQKEVRIDKTNALELLKQYPLGKEYAYIDADKLKGKLTLQPVSQGMRFKPFGMHGASRLVSDYLTDLKFNHFDRKKQYVLMDEENIVWLVGLRSDERYRVSRETQRIIILQVTNS